MFFQSHGCLAGTEMEEQTQLQAFFLVALSLSYLISIPKQPNLNTSYPFIIATTAPVTSATFTTTSLDISFHNEQVADDDIVSATNYHFNISQHWYPSTYGIA